MTILDRLFEIVDDLGGNRSQFERSIGKAPGYLHAMQKQGSVPSTDVIVKVVESYPQYSCDWLVMGKGSKTSSSDLVEEPSLIYNTNKSTIEIAEELVQLHTKRLLTDMSDLINKQK